MYIYLFIVKFKGPFKYKSPINVNNNRTTKRDKRVIIR